MNCAEARDAMLGGEPAELAGAGDTELASHVRSCDDCRRLGCALDRDVRRLARSVSRRRARRVAIVAAAPIAAVILAFVVSQRDGGGPRRDISRQSLPPARVVSVDVAPGQRAAVLKTADPTVTLVWLRDGGE